MNFKTREEVIHSMCLTYRHDYGLRKNDTDPPWVSGMTLKDSESLYKVMEQLYDNTILPMFEHYQKVENAAKRNKRNIKSSNRRRK
jgi:hypothetical protein